MSKQRSGVWKADPSSEIVTRPGDPPQALGVFDQKMGSPDIWRTANNDYVVVGTDVTERTMPDCPKASIGAKHERLVMIPAVTFTSAACR